MMIDNVNQNRTPIRLEHALFAAAFLIALTVRLIALGQMALDDHEASLALQALALARGQAFQLGAQPGLVLWTSILFWLTGSSAFGARLLPALFGSLLVLAPWQLREKLGGKAALVLAFALALEPGLVSLSRTADGAILAITLVAWALGFFIRRRYTLMTAALALGFLCGTPFWAGILSLGLVLGWAAFMRRGEAAQEPEASLDWHTPALAAVGVLVVAGTLFFTHPAGLSAAGSGLVEYVRGWSASPLVVSLRLLAVLFLYSPLAVVLAAVGGVQGLTQNVKEDVFLLRWWLVALLLALVYPARGVADLGWSLLPMLALAARMAVRFVRIPAEGQLVQWVSAVGVFIMASFCWSVLAGLTAPPVDSQALTLQYAKLGVAILMILLVLLVIALGWSVPMAGRAFSLGMGAFLLIYTLSASFNAAGMGRNPNTELWRMSPAIGEADLLQKTVSDLSEWNTGQHTSLDVTLVDFQSPALQWMLRDWPKVNLVQSLSPSAQPDMIITSDQVKLAQVSPYTGQQFSWQETPDWEIGFPGSVLSWIVFREVPASRPGLILWVRSDLFPGAASLPANPSP